jgi:hypothetical protein
MGLVRLVTKGYDRVLAGLLLMVLVLAAPVMAAVTISPTGGDDTTLIMNAISAAAADDHVVILNPGTYYAHDIMVAQDVTIRADAAGGHGPADTIIDAQSLGRIFTIWGYWDFAIDNLTLQNGKAPGDGGAILDNMNSGSITVTSSVITNCRAGNGGTGSGGAIYKESGTVTVTSSTITNCRAGDGGNGGAIATLYATTTVTSSIITGCRAGSPYGNGGAISLYSPAVTGIIRFCRLFDNTAPRFGNTVFGPDTVRVTDNWWGSSAGPSASDIGGGALAPSWLVLGITASPDSIPVSGTSAVRVNLTYNNTGLDTASGGIFVPGGMVVIFTAGDGSVLPVRTATASGIATTTFRPAGSGTVPIVGVVDNQGVFIPVEVTGSSGAATAIEVDPVQPATVYAGIDGQGVYRSPDSGSSWTHLTLPTGANLQIRALAPVRLAGSPATTLYAGSYGGGVYYSTDGGASWDSCGPLPDQNVLSLVANSTAGVYAGTESGVYASTDGCSSWTAMNNGLP